MSKNGKELDIIMLGNGRIVSYDSEFIFEHSNYANTVRLISPDIGLGYTVELNIVKADGIEGVPLGMRYIGATDCDVEGIARKCYIWATELSEWHLYKSGKMLISISAINGQGVRIQSGIVQVYVNMSVRGAYTPLDTSTAEVLAAQIAALSDLVSDAIDSVEFIIDKSSGEYLKLKVTTVSGDESYIDIGADKSIVNIISLVDADGRNILRITKASGEVIDIHLSALDKAAIDAENAFNNSSIALTVADDANRTAKEALEQAKVTGTQIEVNSEFQQKIAFIDDPQAQIDAKTQVNVGGVPQGVVDFTSDPQAQIDAKTAVNIGGVRQSVVEFVSDPQEQINSRTQVIIDGNVEPEVRFISDPQRQINSKTQVNVDGVGQGLISFTSDPQAQINNLNAEITRVDNSAQQGIAQVDVKAEQGITTANEAKEIAQEALDQSKVTGTQVQVGGVFQPTLDFTSDPQTQLNSKYSEINPQPPYQAVELQIPDGANLNDYLTPAVYISRLADHKIINLPNTDNGAGKLVVYTSAEGNNYITQEWIQVASTNRWVRSSNGDYNPRMWSEWRKVLYEEVAYIAPNELKNLNDAPKNAYVKMSYSTGSDVQNRPTTSGGFWLSGFSSADYGEQIYASDNGNLYFRPFSGGVWGNWKTALLIDPTQLEISTANGWTIGGINMAGPSEAGVYIFQIRIMSSTGALYPAAGFSIVYPGKTICVPIPYSPARSVDLYILRGYPGSSGWSWWAMDGTEVTYPQLHTIAYKKII